MDIGTIFQTSLFIKHIWNYVVVENIDRVKKSTDKFTQALHEQRARSGFQLGTGGSWEGTPRLWGSLSMNR